MFVSEWVWLSSESIKEHMVWPRLVLLEDWQYIIEQYALFFMSLFALQQLQLCLLSQAVY